MSTVYIVCACVRLQGTAFYFNYYSLRFIWHTKQPPGHWTFCSIEGSMNQRVSNEITLIAGRPLHQDPPRPHRLGLGSAWLPALFEVLKAWGKGLNEIWFDAELWKPSKAWVYMSSLRDLKAYNGIETKVRRSAVWDDEDNDEEEKVQPGGRPNNLSDQEKVFNLSSRTDPAKPQKMQEKREHRRLNKAKLSCISQPSGQRDRHGQCKQHSTRESHVEELL